MTDSHSNSRLEAFCDGVFAIALTILIFDIRIPANQVINTPNDLWLAIVHLLPSLLAFLLSFMVIFITWVNHHASLKLLHKSSPAFLYANGFLLLTIVVIPFPTSLMGTYLFTELAAPAVVLYAAVNVLNAVAWIFLSRAALTPTLLTKNDMGVEIMRRTNRSGFYAMVVYTLCAILAFWFPLAIAIVLCLIWAGWLIYGVALQGE